MTKAETLEFIKQRLEKSKVAPLLYFTYREWENREYILRSIIESFTSDKLIIRSSALSEDSYNESLAGKFESVLNVNRTSYQHLENAIESVFNSYTDSDPNNQVLIQPMINDVVLSGVIFTQDQKTGSPYYVINYDDFSGKTDTVTSGEVTPKSLKVWRDLDFSKLKSDRIRTILGAVVELEQTMGSSELDIEVALDSNFRVWTLQVRPLIMNSNQSKVIKSDISATLENIGAQLRRYSKPSDFLYGCKTIFGDMPDWNPAEIIGTSPNPLASSLYHALITGEAWLKSRIGLGYRHIPTMPLMNIIGGHPYIDLRKSFNSLLPHSIESVTGERLVNAWIDRVSSNPILHDKVEFKVATTCYTPKTRRFLADTYPDLLSNSQIEKYIAQLKELTDNCVLGKVEYSLSWCLEKATILDDIQLNFQKELENEETVAHKVNEISLLISRCQSLGTVPFAAAARHAFIAESIVRDSLSLGLLTNDQVNEIKRSFSTVSSSIIESMIKTKIDSFGKDEFFKKYGHIRPSSYDIMSERYDSMERFEDLNVSSPSVFPSQSITNDTLVCLSNILDHMGYKFSATEFVRYYQESVKLREWIKLVFTRDLSLILEKISTIGESLNFSKNEMALLDIEFILKNAINPNFPSAIEKEIYRQNRMRSAYTSVHMNYLLESSSDLYVIPVQRSVPNFITFKKVSAPSVILRSNESARNDLSGKIVCIERADPGFDWLFGCSIAGLITKYGGANSHMAIRCSEFSLPAAIGCGELIYNSLINAEFIELNCENEQIIPLLCLREHDQVSNNKIYENIDAMDAIEV
ncbi:hypothetical protein DZA51_03965 [Vibrio campbellii]|nr:hypothetical protein DZA51_03965 [Vibrio campbellii]